MRKVRTPEPEGFETYWSVWQPAARNTDGRGLAREAFRKHILNGADPNDIIDGARWFIRNLSQRDKDYVPLSATWLNRETFVDLAPRERDYQRRLAERTQQPKPAPSRAVEPVVAQMTQADREASARRVYEKLGLRPPEVTH